MTVELPAPNWELAPAPDRELAAELPAPNWELAAELPAPDRELAAVYCCV